MKGITTTSDSLCKEMETYSAFPAIVLAVWIIEAEGRIHASVNYGLLPGRRQAIIWIDAGILLIRTLGRKCIWKCRLR